LPETPSRRRSKPCGAGQLPTPRRGRLGWWHQATLAVAALTFLAVAETAAAVDAPAPALPTRVSGAYLGALHLGSSWQRYLGVPSSAIFADPGRAREMLRAVALDAKNIGFNTLVLSSFFYPGLTKAVDFPVNFPYSQLYGREGFVELTAQAAERAGLGLVVALSPEKPLFENRDFAKWVQTCEDTPWARRQVEHYARLPAVKGVLCAFESWGALGRKLPPAQLAEVFRSIRSLKSFIEAKHLFYLQVPAAGLSALNPRRDFPADMFTVFTPQVNPTRYYDQPTMDSVFAAHSASPRTGIEMNVWSSSLLKSPLNRGQRPGETPNEGIVAKWQQLQAAAVLRFRPKVVTWEDYANIAFPEYSDRQKFYGGRGWAMNINARLAEPTLTLYDPMVSGESTRVIGGSPDLSVSYSAAGRCDAFDPRLGGDSARLTKATAITYPNPARTPIISGGAGSISLWIRPAAGANARSTSFLATACRQPNGPSCLMLALEPTHRLSLSLTDAAGHRSGVSADVASWSRPTDAPEWHQVTATWDSRKQKLNLYLDGQAGPTSSAGWAPFPLSDKFVVGSPISDDSSGAPANVAELRVYSTALGAPQVLREYQTFLRKGMRDGEPRPQCPSAH
jgi:hypothetical protein